MSHKFPTISVTKLFVSIDPRPATEEERWMGLPAIVPGYRPSGNTFIDHFMPLLHAITSNMRETSRYASVRPSPRLTSHRSSPSLISMISSIS